MPEEGTDMWDSEAAGWDANPAVVTYAGGAWTSLRAAVSLAADMRVLDFGCGTGLLTERIVPHVGEVVAVDASQAMIDVLAAKALPNVRAAARRWTPETIARDELAGEPFDLVVCSSVCAFLEDYPEAEGRLLYRGSERIVIDGILCMPVDQLLRELTPNRPL